ncbi:Phosphatidic acid phosphatase type 2/haloperoxidase [Trema orientale]|uniref:Phosphatidic acid phosphatase type 2/haloperoxidase n=1 Tax=Trema orientale TaxID=63057 RepID=A0A2P5FP70_TREOI|nr:Phosphatidic acid phosphatase type 2/haloperoxidase [Trema orientale]
MSASTTTQLHQPILKFFPGLSCRLKSLKPISTPTFPNSSPSSKLVLSSAFVFKKGPFERNNYLGPKTMFELVKTPAFRNGNGDEGVKTIEQEALVDGSSKFRPGFMSDGLESTLNKLSKWLVSGLFAAVILWRHDAEAVWAAMGSVINAMLSVALKRILNQERPASAMKSDPGMPSSHSQSIFFTFTFAILSILEWLGINEITIATSLFVLALGSYLSWLRVSQRLHTLSQVVVGAVIGSIFCIFWYLSWNAFVLQAFNSSLWVQIIVILGAAAFCLGFVFYVYQNWFRDER